MLVALDGIHVTDTYAEMHSQEILDPASISQGFLLPLPQPSTQVVSPWVYKCASSIPPFISMSRMSVHPSVSGRVVQRT